MPRAALSNVSIKQLVAELRKRQARLADLIKQRDALNAQIEELEGLAPPGAPAAPAQSRKVAAKSKKAPKRATGKPLAEYVREALAAAPKGLSIADLEKRILAAGYPTSVERIYKQISAVLAKGGFKRIGRGIYVLKSGAKAAKKAAKTAKAVKPAAKAKKPAKKRTFTCPTCKEEFASGMMLGDHYKTEPSHRAK